MPNGTAFTFDVKGLLAWSKSSGNQFAVAQADVSTGQVRIYAVAWNEFCDVYEDESATVTGLGVKREQLTEEHRTSIIAIADRANATFGRRGPNDSAVDWKIAGIASCEKLVVVTDERRKRRYSGIDGIQAVTFEEYISTHE
ncbi:putative transglutaminase-like cysteine proteinase [Bradyrhizobium sp. LB1.3]